MERSKTRMRASPSPILTGLLAVLVGSASCSPTSSQQPPKPLPPPLEYLGEWGIRGDGAGQFDHPVSVATDAVGNVYVADVGSGYVHKFSPQGTPLLAFQDPALKAPSDIAVDSGGAIYVADPLRGRVVIFAPDGKRLRQIRCARGGESKGRLAVAVDEDGNILVVDAGRDRLQRFNPRGRLLNVWDRKHKSPVQLSSPADIDAGPDGSLYVIEEGNRRVVKLSRNGELVAAFSVPTPSGENVTFNGIAVSAKYVFTADTKEHRLYVWTLDGQYKLSDELGARVATKDPIPYDVAVNPKGELLVLDPVGARVLRFRINF